MMQAGMEHRLRRALEAQDAEESWTDEERRALSAHIEEGYLQAERGKLIGGAQARRDIQGMKDNWREGRLPKQGLHLGSNAVFVRCIPECVRRKAGRSSQRHGLLQHLVPNQLVQGALLRHVYGTA